MDGGVAAAAVQHNAHNLRLLLLFNTTSAASVDGVAPVGGCAPPRARARCAPAVRERVYRTLSCAARSNTNNDEVC